MSFEKSVGRWTVNLNTILTTGVVALLGFYFSSMSKTKESVEALGTTMTTVALNQQNLTKDIAELKDHQKETNKQFEQFMPRQELMLRFSSLESEILNIKTRTTANEMELFRLKATNIRP